MAASSVATFWLIAILLIIVPGPDWAFVLSAGLRGGSVAAAVGGLAIGYAAITSVVAAGVGTLVARTPGILTGLTVAGGLYLMWHGARTFAGPAAPIVAAAAPAGRNRALLIRGIGVSGLNPKGLLVLLALLPQFASPRGNWPMSAQLGLLPQFASPRGNWPLSAQLGLLGLVFTLSCALFYLGLGSSARKVLHTRPRAAAAISRLSGAAMFVIGAALLIERLVR